MPRFSNMLGIKGRSNAHGGHQIRDNQVMARTHEQAINPCNPGSMTSARSVPVVAAPRYFKPGEAQALAEFACRKQQELGASKVAYKALKTVERADAQLTEVHRKYETVVAKSELHKVAANVQHARELHHQRPEYAMLSRATATARVDAGDAIGRYMQTANQLAGA